MSTKKGSQSHEFSCQIWRSCSCVTGYKLLVVDRKGVTVYELFRNEPHTAESHATSKNKFLAPLQKGAIMRSLMMNTTVTTKQIWQLTYLLLDYLN